MTAIADQSDMPIWPVWFWVLLAVVILLGAAIVAAIHALDTHPRRADRGQHTQSRPARACSVQTCPQDGDWAINGWRLCVDHMLLINGRKS